MISLHPRGYKVGMKPLLSMVGLLLLTGCGFQLRSWDLAPLIVLPTLNRT
ncbi:MAG: hypothetical protein Ct9H300mP8_00230 [Gammaproteobacteria bacterium]|nr:MAG: hypothetical protein Ct9H300mP8_00230 [Gammaproteobacteria bacterium]